MAKHKVLSTKKLEPSLVEKAKESGVEIIEQEAIRVKSILAKEKWDEIFSLLEKKIEFAVFTSSNAVTAVKKYLNEYVNHLPQQWKIFCLSGKTKEFLEGEEELFGTIKATAWSAKELAERIIESGAKELIFFCSDRRREELPTILQNAGVHVQEVMVYEVEETPSVATDDFEAVLFFSPSAVQSFFSANQLKKDVVCFAIGQTTANSLMPFTHSKLYVSKQPTQEALLNEVVNYFKMR
ncbi:uroporphyrinogen-III synthase [Flavisolibacter ginsenosidimutans]|uniref:Uroporphyrinogen-III synthase n=1 Tax=Flavisolibacter ginsenosidimutans TaxID=661481 RepID=A0A5B8UM57_9BACT|nr:uroporphyrinogen-III synthase [Flavisolibacter ginsenosidimutans]QEC57744.1 uroporphyrinogen-III synthase [Flavisolibacter ginsenosidimutans]